MDIPRSAGILIHPSSLPGPHGMGDLGQDARRFVDVVSASGFSWWQILPLNPPDFQGSPYSSNSAFASDTSLIALDELVELGFLEAADLFPLLEALEGEAEDEILIHTLPALKRDLLKKAHGRFRSVEHASFESFCEDNAYWLDDWALFAALKGFYDQADWREWPQAFVRREPSALQEARVEHQEAISLAKFSQWLFAEQWASLREYAADRGVKIIGDIPIFVAMDSADVWANRENFEVDLNGQPSHVAGVPPDYFSEFGQLWGSPLYAWDVLASQGYAWWVSRVRRTLAMVDVIRIDHFRGFESYWAVPAGSPNAVLGEWRKGPADAFFEALEDALGALPFIAEDLGIITDEVIELRDRLELPGMRIMQFAFDGNPAHSFLPDNFPEDCVAYLGTHDNDTTVGWYEQTDEGTRHNARTYLSSSDADVFTALKSALAESAARLVVFTAQDILDLDTLARTNTPGTSENNWVWRMTAAQLEDEESWAQMRNILTRSGRGN